MSDAPSHFTIDEVARDIATALGPRRPCIEVIDPVMARVLRAKTEWERRLDELQIPYFPGIDRTDGQPAQVLRS